MAMIMIVDKCKAHLKRLTSHVLILSFSLIYIRNQPKFAIGTSEFRPFQRT